MDSDTDIPQGKDGVRCRHYDILCMHYPSMIAQLTGEDLHHLAVRVC